MSHQGHETLLNQCRLYLSSIGALAIKIDTPGMLFDRKGNPVRVGTKGVSDTLNCLKGRFIAVEMKTGSGRLTLEQKNFGKAVERAGGIFIQARSIDDIANRLEMEGLA